MSQLRLKRQPNLDALGSICIALLVSAAAEAMAESQKHKQQPHDSYVAKNIHWVETRSSAHGRKSSNESDQESVAAVTERIQGSFGVTP